MIQAEWEGNWPLHLEAFENIIPIFFAAGYANYARWGLYYIRSMEASQENVHSHFMERGAHYPAFCYSMASNVVIYGDRGVIKLNWQRNSWDYWAINKCRNCETMGLQLKLLL